MRRHEPFPQPDVLAQLVVPIRARQDRGIRRVAGQQPKPEVAHFVRRLRTVDHVRGGRARIVPVRRRVVVGITHRDHRSTRQVHGCRVAVVVLPVKIPVPDPDQRRDAAVRQRRLRLHLPRQVVRVRIHAEHVDVDRQRVAVLDRVRATAPAGMSMSFDPILKSIELRVGGVSLK